MPIKKVEVVPFLEKWRCDSCGKGEMESVNIQLLSNPPKTKHICNNCGKVEYSLGAYPTYVFVEKKKPVVRKPRTRKQKQTGKP